MAVHPHKTGGYRAYKKIHGVEHQFYSLDENIALQKQQELDQKSKLAKSLKAKPMFAKCGRLIGARIYLDNRPSKKTTIKMRVQLSINGKQRHSEKTYLGLFEPCWLHAFEAWRNHYNLTPQDVLDHKKQLVRAKQLYIQDVSRLEQKGNTPPRN